MYRSGVGWKPWCGGVGCHIIDAMGRKLQVEEWRFWTRLYSLSQGRGSHEVDRVRACDEAIAPYSQRDKV